jgi:AcrR family transcriptional regulator
MARTQAKNFDKRRAAILQCAAELYARKGFLGTSLGEIGEACETSKSLLYHYFDSKEDILFYVMISHVEALAHVAMRLETIEETPDRKIHILARDLMRYYHGAQAAQKILLNEMHNLSRARRDLVVMHQRQVLDVADRLLMQLRPPLRTQPTRRRPIVMMFFGMLNWTHIWFDPNGPATGEEIADLAAGMFLRGLPQ